MLEKQKIEPCIPPKKNRKETIEYCKTTYKTRHKVENLFAKLKDWWRITARYDRCAHTFQSAIYLAATINFWLWALTLSGDERQLVRSLRRGPVDTVPALRRRHYPRQRAKVHKPNGFRCHDVCWRRNVIPSLPIWARSKWRLQSLSLWSVGLIRLFMLHWECADGRDSDFLTK